MSIAMTRPPAAIYREDQWFGWWAYGLAAALMVLGVGSLFPRGAGVDGGLPALWNTKIPIALLVGVSLPTIIVVGVLKMTTEVSHDHIQVWFGFVPTYRHVVALEAVRKVEVVDYRPIRDCGGWGIRRDRHGRVLNARGNRGVRLTLDNGSQLLIGSQRPEELARWIDQEIRPAA
jgi:hypothetical protein